jgi:hypothetical protein
MQLTCAVEKPMETEGDRRYLSVDIGTESTSIKLLHRKSAKSVIKLVDPLCGNVLRVKVPFRYNRVMCNVTGNKVIQELVKGDKVRVDLKYCGWWVAGEHGGPAWKLVSLTHQGSAGTGSGE